MLVKRHSLREKDTGYSIFSEIFKDCLLRTGMLGEHLCVCKKKNTVIFFMFIGMTFYVIVQCFEAQLF